MTDPLFPWKRPILFDMKEEIDINILLTVIMNCIFFTYLKNVSVHKNMPINNVLWLWPGTRHKKIE